MPNYWFKYHPRIVKPLVHRIYPEARLEIPSGPILIPDLDTISYG